MQLHEAINDPVDETMPFLYGSETEFGKRFHSIQDSHRSSGEIDEMVAQRVEDACEGVKNELWEKAGLEPGKSYFAPNGGRIYRDYNAHFEVTTPECSGLYELLIYELAAERIAMRGLRILAENEVLKSYTLNKRSSDQRCSTWGAHENITNEKWEVDYSDDDYQLRLKPIRYAHQLTRNIYTGEGGLMMGATFNELRFVMSPRMAGCRVPAGTYTTEEPPVVYNGYKPGEETHGRMQNMGAANISPWAIAVKHGMNAVVSVLARSDYIDIGKDIPFIALKNDDRYMKYNQAIAGNELDSLGVEIRDSQGRKWWPTVLQRHLAMLALESCSEEMSPDEVWTCNQVVEVCDQLERDPAGAANRVDWLARRQYLLEKGMPDTAFDYRDEAQYADLDFAWDTLAHTDTKIDKWDIQGKAILARNKGNYGWHNVEIPIDSEISRAMYTPPAGRATERVERVIYELETNGHSTLNSWDFTREQPKHHRMPSTITMSQGSVIS